MPKLEDADKRQKDSEFQQKTDDDNGTLQQDINLDKSIDDVKNDLIQQRSHSEINGVPHKPEVKSEETSPNRNAMTTDSENNTFKPVRKSTKNLNMKNIL